MGDLSISAKATRPPCRQAGNGKRSHKQRGAEALGGALVMMLLLPLMFLIVDIAWGVFVKVTLQHAVREGVRYAITSQTATNAEGANMGHLGSIKAKTITAAGGILAGQEDKVSVTFYTPDTLAEDTGASRNRGGNVVMVNIENFEYRPLIPVYTIGSMQKLEIREDPPIRISVHAADRMESCPLGVCAPL
jgi:Flp pilus assembly protein TadG